MSESKRKLFEGYLRGDIQQDQVPPSFTRRPMQGPVPLSPVQEQIWYQAHSNTEVPSFYNESITIHRDGELDIKALELTLTEIIRRHEAWRTSFDIMQGRPIQVIHPAPKRITLPLLSLQGSEKSRDAEALRLASEDARRPFDLENGPLVRPLLLRFDENSHRLFLTMHQSVVDGFSVYNIFPSELAAIYAAFVAGRPSPLSELPLQYSDFAYWERKLQQGPILTDQVEYWRRQLDGAPAPIKWPDKRSPASEGHPVGAIRAFDLPVDLSYNLKKLSEREEVTLFMTLLTGFAAVLYRYSDQTDLVVGTVAPAGRKYSEVRQLLGYFLNPVGLRMDLSANPTVHDLLRQSRDVTFGALAHDDVPFEVIAKELNLGGRLNGRPLFRIVITLAPTGSNLDPGWNQTPMDVNSGWARWDLYLELSDRRGGILGRAQYKTDVFTAAEISRFLEDFAAVLEAMIADPRQRLSDLPRQAYLPTHRGEREYCPSL